MNCAIPTSALLLLDTICRSAPTHAYELGVGLPERTVRRLLQRLERNGLVTVSHCSRGRNPVAHPTEAGRLVAAHRAARRRERMGVRNAS